jgi:hypothetical protein
VRRAWPRLAAIDAVALVGAIFATFLGRAVVLHHELLTARSLATYVGDTLICAAPALALSFLAAGLYSTRWPEIGRAGVVAATAWAAVIALFAAVYVGPKDQPLVTTVASLTVAAVVLVAGRELARERLVTRPVTR